MDPRPLWISVWGGVNTLAQALHELKSTKSPAELDRLISKLRFYIVSPGGRYSDATWTGINAVIPGIDNSTISNKWPEPIAKKRGSYKKRVA
jgi:hypothetical protein